MSDPILTKTRLSNGLWEGKLTGPAQRPDLRVSHRDQPVEGVTVVEGDDPGTWDVTIPVPSHAVADGVQTFLIFDGATNHKLGDFTLLAGDAMADDLLAEVQLLREELDMLKRAFRRHCVETM